MLRVVNANIMQKNNDLQHMHATSQKDTDESVIESSSMTNLVPDKADEKDKDKVRRVKLKKLRQVFHVKKGKDKDGAGPKSGGAIA